MRMLGLIGGMSWESTAIYYRHLNELVRERLGGLHSARLLLWSVDFAVVAKLQHAGDWNGAAALLEQAAACLETAGAEALVLCTNTMHRVANRIEMAAAIPLLHIADATAAGAQRERVRRPALLATRFTMEEAFYRDRLRDRHGIEALIPNETERALVHRVIYDELCQGVVLPESRNAFLGVVERLRSEEGADGVILGCTEIAMLLGPNDVDLPLLDSTRLHAEAAAEWALR